jgi:drug/metabolite transporter (DMT)-like permease
MPAPTDPDPGAPLRHGIPLALTALLSGVLASVFLKLAAGLASAEAIALRSLSALALLALILAVRHRQGMRGPLGRQGALRACVDAIAGLTFALAVFRLPLAVLATIHATLPLVTTALSALVLREPMRRTTWAALALGFIGVALILRPGGEVSAAGLALAVISTLAYAARDIVTRSMPAAADPLKSVFLSSTLIGLTALALAQDTDWSVPGPQDLALIGLSVLGFLGANILILLAFRRASVATIAPLRYTSILWALVFDAALWRVFPTAAGWAGIALIVAAGLVLFLPRPRHVAPPRAAA